MKLLWKCSWEDGFVSFVLGRSKQEALHALAELGETLPDDALEPVDHRVAFFVTFQPCHETERCNEDGPHWHAVDRLWSQGVDEVLGDPPPPPPPPKVPSLPPHDPDEPLCNKCGHPETASVHHPAYTRPNKCEFERRGELPAAGPDRPTSE